MLRDRVASVVKEMVNEDEDLIFKNRGLTSALIESQLVKDNYSKLNNKNDDNYGNDARKFELDAYIHSKLQDPELLEMIKKQLGEAAGSQQEESNGRT